MANISYKGFDNKVITIESSLNIAPGALVTVNSDGECAQCSTGQEFIGVCVCKRGNLVSVQVGGYVECKYSGSMPTHGLTKLKANSATAVTAGGSEENGISKYKVLKVDTVSKTVGFIL